MGFLKRGEIPEGQRILAVKMGKLSSSSSHCHCFLLTSGSIKNDEALWKREIRKASQEVFTNDKDKFILGILCNFSCISGLVK